MRRSSQPRATAELSKSIHRQLNAYAIAAGAAGVGMLASAQPAEAKIIYTPAHIRIVQNGSVKIDLNHDGIPDFGVSSFCSCTTYAPVALLGVGVERTNEVWGAEFGGRWMASALKGQVKVGANSAFKEYGAGLYMVIVSQHANFGPWAGKKEAYLGLKFKIGGKTHYGWARVRVFTQQTRPFIRATLTGYAYETIPNKPIITGKTKGPDDAEQPASASLAIPAPKPATLGALASGAPGLSIWRREESVAATPERH